MNNCSLDEKSIMNALKL